MNIVLSRIDKEQDVTGISNSRDESKSEYPNKEEKSPLLIFIFVNKES